MVLYMEKGTLDLIYPVPCFPQVLSGADGTPCHNVIRVCVSASRSYIPKPLPLFYTMACKQSLDVRCVLVPAPWAKKTSRIQSEGIYATLYSQAS